MDKKSLSPHSLAAARESYPEDTKLPRSRLDVHDLLRRPFDVRSLALTGLFILALFYTIYFMRSILLPIVLAILLSYLLRPIVRTLARARIPASISAAVILVTLLAMIGYGFSFLAPPAVGWLQKAPYGLQQLQHKFYPVKQSMAQIANASGEIEKLASPVNPQAKATVEMKTHPITDALFVRTPEFLASALLLFILLYFLLAYDGVFLTKVIKLMPKLADKKRAVSIAHDIAVHISRYLFTVTAINVCLGLAVGTAVGMLGLENPIMWGALVAVLNFIPYIGPLTGIICIAVGAVLSYDSLGYALVFPAVYLGLATLEELHHALGDGPVPDTKSGVDPTLR